MDVIKREEAKRVASGGANRGERSVREPSVPVNDAEIEAKRQAFDQQQFDNKFISDTPEIGTSYSERLDWLAKNQTKYETDDEFIKLGARDYYFNCNKFNNYERISRI